MHDIDIRRALRASVDSAHRGDPNTRVVEELGLRQGLARVDLAVVNGVLHGFEIKSLADTLRRLPLQITVYGQVLDFATIVLAEEHRADAVDMIPEWWAVTVASLDGEAISLIPERKGERNPSVDARALAELLWHEETLALLRVRKADRGYARKPRAMAWDRLCEVYSSTEIGEAVRTSLKGRQPLRVGRARR